MKNNKFDINARELIDNHDTPVNTDALWNNVQAELYPKKKKKFAWVWFSASSIAAIILFSGYIYYSNSTVKVGEAKKATSHIEKQTLKTKETIKRITTATAVEATTDENKINIVDNVKTKNSKIQKEKISKITAPENTSRKIQPISNVIKSEIVTTDLQISDIPARKIKEEVVQKTSTPIISNEKQIIKESKTNINGPQNNKANKIETIVTEEAKVIVEQNTQPNPEENIFSSDELEPKVDVSAENEEERILSRKLKRDFKIGMGFRAGISNSLTTLSANSDAAAQLRTLRNQTESNLETIDFALEVLLKHKTGFYVSTGVDYMKASRKLLFNTSVTLVDSVLGVRNIYVNPITMDTTYEEGWIEQTTTSFRNKEVYNKLHIVNIPFNLGVSINYEQWTFSIQGGALLNVLVKQKGQIMNSESTFYDLNTDEDNWFKDNLGLSFQGAGLIGYNFSDNFQVSGGPSFRSPLIISETINPVKQSQVGLGLQVNARYWFD